MKARRENLCFVKHRDRAECYRQTILRIANASMEEDKVLCNFDELPNDDQIYATRTPPVNKGKFKKRNGARKVKDFEGAKALEDGCLTLESATTFRGMSARANYRSLDRPEISFSTKELCRDLPCRIMPALPNSSVWPDILWVGLGLSTGMHSKMRLMPLIRLWTPTLPGALSLDGQAPEGVASLDHAA